MLYISFPEISTSAVQWFCVHDRVHIMPLFNNYYCRLGQRLQPASIDLQPGRVIAQYLNILRTMV